MGGAESEGRGAPRSSWAEQAATLQAELLTTIARGHPLEECLTAITAAVSRLNAGTRACVFVPDLGRNAFETAFAAELPASFTGAVRGLPIGEPAIGTCAGAVAGGEPVVSEDIAHDERWAPTWRSTCLDHGIRACLSEPALGKDGRAVASLMLCFGEARGPTERERQVARFGAGIAAIAVDRMNEEARRLAQAERQRRVFAQAPGFMCSLVGPDHVYDFVNNAHRRLFGDREWIGRPVRSVFPELEGQGFFELLDRVYATGERFVAHAMTARVRPTLDGPERELFLDFIFEPVLDDDGLVSGIFCEGHDVTDRVRAVAALSASEARGRLILESATEYAIITLDDAGRVTSWSAGAERLLGFTGGEAVGQSAEIFLAPEDRASGVLADDMARARRDRRATNERWHVRKGGERFFASGVMLPLGEREGGGFLNLFRDRTEERRQEEAVAESEARFRTIADNAPVIMWVTDATGVCTYLNARWYDFTGQATGAGEGFGWLEAVHPEDRAMAEHAFTSANAERLDFRTEFRLRRADGVHRWAIDAAAARLTPSGDFLGYVGSVIDIDERRESEARLAFSEEQLRLATEAAEIGLWDVDLVTDALFWPARVKAMFGISPGKPVTMADFYAGLHPDDHVHTAAAFAAAVDPARRALYDVEYRTVGQEDGVVRWVAAKGRGLFSPDGVCTRVIGTAIDVTARKADEVRLRELNERLEQRVAEQSAERNRVWEMSRDLFAIMGFDGRLKAINPAWETTLGRQTEDLLALDFREQVHPEDHTAVEALMGKLLRGEAVERFEDRLRHADGSWRWISWTLVPEGDVFYAVGRDVTAEKEATAELGRAQEALRQAQKMEAMGQLTGGVAHDFNNLLTPIVGSLDMLQRRGLGGEREQRLIGNALQSADRAKTLVQRLLAFARRQPLKAMSVDVGRLVTGMADLLASTTGPQVRVAVDVEEGLPLAKADPNQLEMALLNLGVNARDAMPDGGTLRISATRESVRQPRGDLKRGHYVRLSVADTGFGMDEATLARAIEPFFSTKGIGKGTGLGLSMVHGLAAQLGGGLVIQSRRGVGTNVELWLPVSASPLLAAELHAEPTQAGAVQGLALLVDDEEAVRASTADMLADLGYRVLEAGSGEAALALVAGGTRPDLLVTDHLMPGMTGVDLARAVRGMIPDLPALVVSGYADTEGIVHDLPRLTKPFRSAELAACLAGLMQAGVRQPSHIVAGGADAGPKAL